MHTLLGGIKCHLICIALLVQFSLTDFDVVHDAGVLHACTKKVICVQVFSVYHLSVEAIIYGITGILVKTFQRSGPKTVP